MLVLLCGKPTSGSELAAKHPQGKDAKDASDGQTGEQRDTSADTKVVEQRAGEVDGAGGNGGADKVVAGE